MDLRPALLRCRAKNGPFQGHNIFNVQNAFCVVFLKKISTQVVAFSIDLINSEKERGNFQQFCCFLNNKFGIVFSLLARFHAQMQSTIDEKAHLCRNFEMLFSTFEMLFSTFETTTRKKCTSLLICQHRECKWLFFFSQQHCYLFCKKHATNATRVFFFLFSSVT